MSKMTYWYTEVVRYGRHFADVIVISGVHGEGETPFIFKKYPALVYIEELRDQAIKYTPDYRFLQVINTLKLHFPQRRVTSRRMGYGH